MLLSKRAAIAAPMEKLLVSFALTRKAFCAYAKDLSGVRKTNFEPIINNVDRH